MQIFEATITVFLSQITLKSSYPLNEQLTTNPMQLANPKQRQQFIDTGISYKHWLLNQIPCFCGEIIYLLLELLIQNLSNQCDKRNKNAFLKSSTRNPSVKMIKYKWTYLCIHTYYQNIQVYSYTGPGCSPLGCRSSHSDCKDTEHIYHLDPGS